MGNKKDILRNLREYSAEQIAQAIKDGVVTMYELSKSGNLTPLMRRRIEEQLAVTPQAKAETSVEMSSKGTDRDKEQRPFQQKDDIQSDEKTGSLNVAVPEAVADTVPTVIPDDTDETIEDEYLYNDGKSNRGMFLRPFSFRGRIRRLEYGLSLIFFYIWYFVFSALMDSYADDGVIVFFYFMTMIFAYWFLWAQGAKRCHDRNNSGWYQIIPFYGLWMLFADGNEGVNCYGDNPKGK